MQLAATRPDETLEALAARVYDLGEKPTQATTKAAAKALADANPFLRRIADVPPGTVVDVPPFEKAQARAGETERDDAVVAGLVLDHVGAAAALFARQFAADLDAEAADAEETVKLARSAELKRMKTPGLTEALKDTVTAAEHRAATVKELRTRHDAVLEQLARDLADLTGDEPPEEDEEAEAE